MMEIWIAPGLIALLFVWVVVTYNDLITMRQRCDRAFADIDVQLKQRSDLVPNLVEAVRGYASHERGTLEVVIKARSVARSARTPGAQMQAESLLGDALGRLVAVAEAYPDLKASKSYSDLQDELADIENKISAARRFLNSAVSEYNASLEQLPTVFVASWLRFRAKTYFEATQDSRPMIERAPAVTF
jgi:LemA protein